MDTDLGADLDWLIREVRNAQEAKTRGEPVNFPALLLRGTTLSQRIEQKVTSAASRAELSDKASQCLVVIENELWVSVDDPELTARIFHDIKNALRLTVLKGRHQKVQLEVRADYGRIVGGYRSISLVSGVPFHHGGARVTYTDSNKENQTVSLQLRSSVGNTKLMFTTGLSGDTELRIRRSDWSALQPYIRKSGGIRPLLPLRQWLRWRGAAVSAAVISPLATLARKSAAALEPREAALEQRKARFRGLRS
jgi:hypothetical protein